MRIVCSPALSSGDVDALNVGYSPSGVEQFSTDAREELHRLLASPVLQKPTKVLASLVAGGVIDLRIAWIEPQTAGRSRRIFHDKVGIFSDGNDQQVVFKGSMNETWLGLAADGNLESIDVFASWRNEENERRVADEVEYFDNLWHDRQPGVTVTPFPEVAQQELLDIAEEARWEDYVDEICLEMETAANDSADHRLGARSPRPHQVAALEAWEQRGRRGLLEHATGSGKTFTALCAIHESLGRGEVPLVLVPSELLLSQWQEEITRTLDLQPLVCGGGFRTWEEQRRLPLWTRDGSPDEPRVVLATTLAKLLDDYGKKEAKSAQANTITSELGTQMNVLLDERQVLLDGLDDMKTSLAQLRQEKAELDEQLRRNERLTAMMDKRDMLVDAIKSLDEQIEARQADIAIEMREAWKSLVATRASDLTGGLRDRERDLQLQKMRHEVLRVSADRGADPKICPTCLQTLSDEALARMEVTAADEAAIIEDVERQLRDIQRRLDALEDAARASSETGLRMLWSDLNRLRRDRYTNRDEASELDRRLQEAGDDQSAIRQAQYDHEQTVKKIALTEEGIGEQEDALAENERNLARVRVRLESRGGADVEGARQRRRLCSDLHGLFDQAVDRYRDRLRRSVEADATKLFLQLTTEPEYAGLRINESYGLTILHQDGSEIPVRSAGAEHVVALSLVGALQKNAPLQGPIFIDSPFGRLDTRHTENVVSALPSMTEQMCLLVYEEELRPQLARELLRGQLRAEYSLRRVSARHTELEEIGGRHG